VKLLLDEHYSPAIAEQLQKRGYDVLPVAERSRIEHAHLRQQSDEELLRWARNEGRVLVTLPSMRQHVTHTPNLPHRPLEFQHQHGGCHRGRCHGGLAGEVVDVDWLVGEQGQ